MLMITLLTVVLLATRPPDPQGSKGPEGVQASSPGGPQGSQEGGGAPRGSAGANNGVECAHYVYIGIMTPYRVPVRGGGGD